MILPVCFPYASISLKSKKTRIEIQLWNRWASHPRPVKIQENKDWNRYEWNIQPFPRKLKSKKTRIEISFPQTQHPHILLQLKSKKTRIEILQPLFPPCIFGPVKIQENKDWNLKFFFRYGWFLEG